MRTRTAVAVSITVLLTALPAVALTPTASATNFAVLLSDGSGNLTGQMSASFGPDGSGVALWDLSRGGAVGFDVSRFNPGQGWSPPFTLIDRHPSGATSMDTAVTPDGYLAVCWTESFPAWTQAAVFDPANGWSPVQRLNMSDQPTSGCRVTASGDGAFVFLYQDSTNGLWEPIVQAWRSGVRWMAPEALSERKYSTQFADIAGDGQGGATVVWAEANSTSTDLLATHYNPGETQVVRALIDTLPGRAGGLSFERGPSGQGAAGVVINNPGVAGAANFSLFVTILDSSDAWGPLEIVSDPATDVGSARFSLFPDVKGEVLLVFENGDPSRPVITGRIWNANGTGAAWVPLFDLAPSRSAQLGSSSYLGGASPAVAWRESDAVSTTLSVSTYDRSSGWSEPFHPAPEERNMGAPHAAGGPLGDAWVVFTDNRAQGRAVPVPDVTPPEFVLLSPTEGETFDKASCWVRVAQVPTGGSMFANGVRGELQPDGTWGALVPLLNKTWRILVVLTDANGNSATQSVNVTYEDPLPALQEQLNITAAELDNATRAAVDYFLKIDTIEGESNATKAELNETKQHLDTVTHELGHALDLHNESQGIIQNLSAQLNETEQKANGSLPMEEIAFNFGKIEDELNGTKLDLAASQAAQQQQETDLAFLRQRAEDASSAASMATVAAVAGAALGAAGIASSLRGRGGGGGKEVTVRGWDPKKKEAIQGQAEPGDRSPAEEQLKGNPRH